MGKTRKRFVIALIVFVAALLLAQLFQVEKTNPPVRADISLDPAVKPLLQKACYDCHSNETVWPWYSKVAPVSWLLADDVRGGRGHLNFSEWGNYAGDERSRKLKDIEEEIRLGEMPPWYYSLMHRNSRLSPSERDQIAAWTKK